MLRVYKIGGNVINNPEELRKFLKDFSEIQGKKMLIHGGGKEATEYGNKIGIEAKMIDGRRVTDKETLDLVTMIYAGLINKRIISILQEYSCNAVGLTGADGNVIPADKRNPNPIDFGYVGDINPIDINTDFIKLLLDNGFTPVFCAICRNKEGGLLNCNADTIASSIAMACSVQDNVDLTFCFEKKGVLDKNNVVIQKITPISYVNMLSSGEIYGGMIPKIENAIMALNKGVNSVRICSSKDILNEEGTLISKEY
ncbi:MAG: acetylglutamate kinase [Muribaculaceae bacterium]|nr:acetylglutamate kinase [Muribaculaceae bacterium]